MESDAPAPPYLLPYLRAAAVHGPGFGSLLWASPDTQAARFAAFARAWDLNGQSVLDVGCGRADFLEFLLSQGVRPADYVGIEAVPELADEADRRGRAYGGGATAGAAGPRVTVLRADFVREPARMFVGADVVAFSGSLNTMGDDRFYPTLRRAWDATACGLIFNFLDSPLLAGNAYLSWRRPADVLKFARGLSRDVRVLNDYLEGDCTVVMRKPAE